MIFYRIALAAVLVSSVTFRHAMAQEASIGPRTDARESTHEAATFDVFCDFRCPFCARLFLALFAGSKTEDRDVSFSFRHFPFHSGSEELARFFEAAALNYSDQRQSIIESLYRFLLQSRPENFDNFISALSIVHGFDMALIRRDMDARDIERTITDSKIAAVKRDVGATPTVFFRNSQLDIQEPEDIARYMLDHSPKRVHRPHTAADSDCNSCERIRTTK